MSLGKDILFEMNRINLTWSRHCSVKRVFVFVRRVNLVIVYETDNLPKLVKYLNFCLLLYLAWTDRDFSQKVNCLNYGRVDNI